MNSRFTITIAAAPDRRMDLENELHLLKVGLLYADHSVLCSPKAILFMLGGSIGLLNEEQQFDLMEELTSIVQRDSRVAEETLRSLGKMRRLKRKAKPSSYERRLLSEFRQVQASSFKDLCSKLDAQFMSPSAAQVIEAMNSGMVTLHPLALQGVLDSVIPEFMEFLRHSFTDAGSFPLYDSLSSSIIDAGIREGKIQASSGVTARERNVPLAAALFERLPLFDAATVSEIMDIRKELSAPLARFRSAMIRLSGDLRSMPWEESFHLEVESIVHRDIEPAIQEINEELENNKYLKEIFFRVCDKPTALATSSVLGVALSTAGALPFLTVEALTTGVGAAVEIIRAHKEWRQQQRSIESNQLYFYYKAGRRLT